jgi:hypothetical protein
LVVRGYSQRAEVTAFINMLKSGVADDNAYESRTTATSTPRWQLSLSAAGWLLVVLGSKALASTDADVAVKDLDPADARFLHERRSEYKAAGATDGPMKRLLQLVRREMTWEEYGQDSMVPKEFIIKQMKRIIKAADVVLTTQPLPKKRGIRTSGLPQRSSPLTRPDVWASPIFAPSGAIP